MDPDGRSVVHVMFAVDVVTADDATFEITGGGSGVVNVKSADVVEPPALCDLTR